MTEDINSKVAVPNPVNVPMVEVKLVTEKFEENKGGQGEYYYMIVFL